MKVIWDDDIPNRRENTVTNVPNHQPVMIGLTVELGKKTIVENTERTWRDYSEYKGIYCNNFDATFGCV